MGKISVAYGRDACGREIFKNQLVTTLFRPLKPWKNTSSH
ncbi:hypothetical protein [Coxiella burnetii]|nr:hypothetical protein [Coxiella burnetii]